MNDPDDEDGLISNTKHFQYLALRLSEQALFYFIHDECLKQSYSPYLMDIADMYCLMVKSND